MYQRIPSRNSRIPLQDILHVGYISVRFSAAFQSKYIYSKVLPLLIMKIKKEFIEQRIIYRVHIEWQLFNHYRDFLFFCF